MADKHNCIPVFLLKTIFHLYLIPYGVFLFEDICKLKFTIGQVRQRQTWIKSPRETPQEQLPLLDAPLHLHAVYLPAFQQVRKSPFGW